MKKTNLFKFILVILMLFLGGSLILGFLKGMGINTDLFDAKDTNYLECLLELIFALIIYFTYHKYFRIDYKEITNGFKKYGNLILKYFALFLAIKIASAVITNIVGSIIGVQIGESENQNAIVSLTSSAPIMMLISTAILAPIVEEGIFRLALRKVINNKYIFIILSGLLFGFMHIFPTELCLSVALTYSIVYVTTGVYLAYVYVETDNIWVPIAIHALNNFISMLAIIMMT